jgi:hypothetical protein
MIIRHQCHEKKSTRRQTKEEMRRGAKKQAKHESSQISLWIQRIFFIKLNARRSTGNADFVLRGFLRGQPARISLNFAVCTVCLLPDEKS